MRSMRVAVAPRATQEDPGGDCGREKTVSETSDRPVKRHLQGAESLPPGGIPHSAPCGFAAAGRHRRGASTLSAAGRRGEPPPAQTTTGYDTISGDKGTGKSAIFRIITEHRADFEELKGIELLPAFNVAGQPVFYQLTRSRVLTEGEYNSLWKAYILSVVGNFLLDSLGEDEPAPLPGPGERGNRDGREHDPFGFA